MATARRDLERLAARLTSARTGLLARVRLAPRRDALGVGCYYPTLANLDVLPAGGAFGPPPCRAHRHHDGGVEDVLLEAAERYAAAFCDPARLVRGRAGDDERFLAGPRMPLYADWQYALPGWPFQRLTGESDLHWIPGRSLVTGRVALVPAALVHVPYRPRVPDERLGFSTSTGMACDFTWARACLRGLLEVCERDAFMIAWENRLSLPRLVPTPGSRLARELDAVLAGEARVTFVDLTSDLGVPALAAMLVARGRGRRLATVGLAAGPRRAAAAHEALSEAIFELRRQRELLASGPPPAAPAADFSDVTDWSGHGLVYAHAEHQPALDFLTASPDWRPLDDDVAAGDEVADDAAGDATGGEPTGDDAAELRRWVARLAACGLEVVAVGLTTRDLAELGLHAVKIVVPEAVPVPPDHRYRPLGHRRLREAPPRFGHAAAAELNPYPHPLA